MYKKEFEIRWNDLDANGHLANVSYVSYAAHTRMSFLIDCGFSMQLLKKYHIGPVVFHEHMYYFKEAFIGKPVTVSLELTGLSKDGMFFSFSHNFYDSKGKNFARSEMIGGWIDLTTRKLTGLPSEILQFFDNVPKANNFKELTKEDTRNQSVKPADLNMV